jgi:hypothetical protein
MSDRPKGSEGSPEEHPVETSPAGDARRMDFTPPGGVAVAAILHLLRLMGAELVLVRGLDVALLEQAVRTKLGEFTSPTTNQDARQAGLAHARYLVDQVLTQIRAQAELKKCLAVGNDLAAERGPDSTDLQSSLPVSKLLN